MVLSTPNAEQMYEPQPAPAGSGLRLLIADDNRDAAESLALLMQLDGHVVHIANDGPQALAMAGALLPDVSILDIGMPGMDGNAVARHIREAMPGQRMLLVAVTGRSNDLDRARARDAGFDQYFTKPVALGTLMSCILRWREEGGSPSPLVRA